MEQENKFEITRERESIYRVFIGNLMLAYPFENWDEKVWFLVEKFNSYHEEPMTINDLKNLYSSIKEVAIKRITEEKIGQKDISTFMGLYNTKLEEEISDEDKLDIKKLPEFIFWNDFNKKIFKEQRWYVKNLIPKEGLVILASISGHKKSWLTMELCKAISSGQNFLNQEQFKTERANVLYINAENSESEIQRRGRKLKIEDENNKFYLVNVDNINLNTKEGAVWLKTFIEFYKIDVVFIDTFIAVAGGLKEEKSEEIRGFFRRFNSLKNQNVALVFLLHMRKPTNFEGKTPKKEQVLGSQDKVASSDVLLMIYSSEETDEINVYQRKNRLGKEIKPFQIIMKDQEDETIELSYGGELDEDQKKKDEAKDLIIEILENGGKGTKEILELTKKQIGNKNVRTALSELVKDGLIVLGKQGRQNFYSLTEEKTEDPLSNF